MNSRRIFPSFAIVLCLIAAGSSCKPHSSPHAAASTSVVQQQAPGEPQALGDPRELPDIHVPSYDEWTSTTQPVVFKLETRDSQINDVDAILTTPFELSDTYRYDRIVVWSKNLVVVYPAGRTSPIWSNHDLSAQPIAFVWTPGGMLVWNGREIELVDASTGKGKWMTRLDTLGQAPPLSATQLAAASTTANIEQFITAWPIHDRVQLTTSAGRIVSLDHATGNLVWQIAATDQPIAQLAANDNFTVVRFNADGDANIVALRSSHGDAAFQYHLSIDTYPTPVNIGSIALADNGTLVWTEPDHLRAKNLRQPDAALKFDDEANDSRHRYDGATHSDSLIITGDKIIAMENGGQDVAIHSLIDDKLLRLKNSEGKEMDAIFQTGAPDPQRPGVPVPFQNRSCSLQLVDNWMFLFTPGAVTSYELDHPGDSGEHSLETPEQSSIGFVTRFSVVVAKKEPSAEPKDTHYGLVILARSAPGHPRDITFDITERSGIRQWAVAAGGVYYLSGDNKLHFLRGTK